MVTTRRKFLIAVGGAVAGGGALVGTGAFTTVQAERTVNIETTGDSSAFLALQPARSDDAFVEETNGTIEVQLDGTDSGSSGLNKNAITTFRNLVRVTNNGTQNVTTLRLEFSTTPNSVNPNNTFTLLVDYPPNSASDEVGHSSGGDDILTGINGIPDTLTPGDSINFGFEVDLINGGNGNNDLPPTGDYRLTISALTQ